MLKLNPLTPYFTREYNGWTTYHSLRLLSEFPKSGPALKVCTYKTSGVDAVVNKVNGYSCIGSAAKLYHRSLDYRLPAYLENR